MTNVHWARPQLQAVLAGAFIKSGSSWIRARLDVELVGMINSDNTSITISLKFNDARNSQYVGQII